MIRSAIPFIRCLTCIAGAAFVLAACAREPEAATDEQEMLTALGEPTVDPEPGEIAEATEPALPAAAQGEAAAADPSMVAVAPAAAPMPAVPMPPFSYRVAGRGKASFLIDAPLEKIRGNLGRLGGRVTLDPRDLSRTRGEITLGLDGLKTHTFDDADKNATQTGHARNWLEIGSDVDAATRRRNSVARFTIKRIEGLSARALPGDAPAAVEATVVGTLMLHGRSAETSVPVTVTIEGGAELPSKLHVVTREPLRVSLEHHDVKPRDLAGRFLSGALEKVGKKIDDLVQVSLEFDAAR